MALRWNMLFKAILFMGFASFLLFGTLGLGRLGMSMEPTVNSNCPFMPGMTTVCKMNPLEHIAAWQSMFTATAAQTILDLLLGLLTVCVLVFFFKKHAYSEVRAPLQFRYREAFPFFRSSLQEAFSNGIIHSKVF